MIKNSNFIRSKSFRMCLFFVLLLVIWGVYAICAKKINQRVVFTDDSFSMVYQFESPVYGDKMVSISGWAFRQGKSSKKEKYDLLLYDVQKQKLLFPTLERRERYDVNDYFLCDIDYSECGFIAKINESDLDFERTDYELLLRKSVKGNREAIHTGQFLTGNGITREQPKIAETGNDEINVILTEGQLIFGRPDVGMWVYQYQSRLFWITNSDFGFEEDGLTVIEYMLYTNQVHNLPEERLEKNVIWDGRGFIYERNVIYEDAKSGIRVASKELPKEYSITKISTGYYTQENGFIWQEEFRPFYEFR